MTTWKTYEIRTTETVRRTYSLKARSEAEARSRFEDSIEQIGLEPVDIQELGEEIESGGVMEVVDR